MDLCAKCRATFAAYGRQGGRASPPKPGMARKGGIARIAALTPADLKQHMQRMNRARWGRGTNGTARVVDR